MAAPRPSERPQGAHGPVNTAGAGSGGPEPPEGDTAPRLHLHVKAALHEVRCWECRVTWRSWAQRLVGLKRGYSPRLSKQHRALVERARRAEERLAELEGALNWQTSCTSCARVLDSAYAETMRAEQAEALLREFVCDTPCDPHPGNGFCQTHGERKPCPQAQAKALLAALDRPEGTQRDTEIRWQIGKGGLR